MSSTPNPGPTAAVLTSGGVESSFLCVDLLDSFDCVFPIYVKFGSRWDGVELAHLGRFLAAAGENRPGLMPLTVLDEPTGQLYGGEHWSQAGGPGVPGFETPDEAVYLPGRNVLLAAKAAVWCRLREVRALAFGLLKGNPFPDSTPEFFGGLQGALNRAMGGRLTILRPYENLSKAEVLARGRGLPVHLTFSCLDPVAGKHCGRCNKCAERQHAFRDAGFPDRTEYAARPRPAR